MEEDLIEMGHRSRKYFEEHFEKQKLMNEMEKYFR